MGWNPFKGSSWKKLGPVATGALMAADFVPGVTPSLRAFKLGAGLVKRIRAVESAAPGAPGLDKKAAVLDGIGLGGELLASLGVDLSVPALRDAASNFIDAYVHAMNLKQAAEDATQAALDAMAAAQALKTALTDGIAAAKAIRKSA